MRKRYFFYEFGNGYSTYLTAEEADEYAKKNKTKIIRDDCEREKNSFFRMVKDGFKSGWNPALGLYVRGKKHFGEILREKGLTEIGKEKVSQKFTGSLNPINDEVLKEAIGEFGADISGQEAEALKKGEIGSVAEPTSEKGGFCPVTT